MISLITSILGVFGAGLGSLLSWAVSWFEARKAAEQQAANQMDADISAHAQDGVISVGDMDSALAQMDNLKVQAEQLDSMSAPPAPGGKP